MSVAQEIINLKAELPEQVTLVAVSKYHPASAIEEAYAAGQRIFGESQVQELRRKYEEIHLDGLQWHFIGHLQTNKVKYIAPYIALIHSVDSLKLLLEINRQGEKCGRRIRCLLQLHVAQEENKYGFTETECWEYLESGAWKNLKNVELCGIMCIATNTEDENLVRAEFRRASEFFQKAKERFFAGQDSFSVCSWGMSDDYPLAIQEGSNMIRVGSKIFGARVY